MAFEVAITVDGESDKDLAASAGRIEVYEYMGETTSYYIAFGAQPGDGDIPILVDDRIGPETVLGIFTRAGDQGHCLVTGPVYGQEIHLTHARAGSSLQVLGGDRCVEMDREIKVAVFADATDSEVVSSVLSSYPKLKPDIEDTSATHAKTKHSFVQCETDLDVVRRLARRNGFLFWITADEKGKETAHFRRPQLDGEVAGTIDLAKPGIEALDITWHVHRPTSVVASEIDANTKEDIDGSVASSPLPPLGATPFSGIATKYGAARVSASVDDGGDLRAHAEAVVIDSSFFLRARCSVTSTTAGTIFRSHSIVMVQGAGSRHSGKYYCAGVRHVLDDGTHTMELELIRNAWGFKA